MGNSFAIHEAGQRSMVCGHGIVYRMLLLNAHTLSRQVEAGAEEDPSGLEETVKEV